MVAGSRRAATKAKARAPHPRPGLTKLELDLLTVAKRLLVTAIDGSCTCTTAVRGGLAGHNADCAVNDDPDFRCALDVIAEAEGRS